LRPFATLRSQILFGFLLVMAVVLAIVGGLTFRSVSTLLTNNSETHIHQTAIQAGGRLDALIERINTFSLQIVTDARVQALMLRETTGSPADFAERQALSPIVQRALDFISGVQTVELFNLNGDRLFPLGERRLEELVGPRMDPPGGRAERRPRLDRPDGNEDSVLAIRSVRLIDRWFRRAARPEGEARGRQHGTGDRCAGAARPRPADGGSRPAGICHGENAFRSDRLDDAHPDPGRRAVRRRRGASQRPARIRRHRHRAVLVLSFMLSTMITEPLRKLIRTMRSVRRGILQPSSVSSSNREIRELNHTYNRMVSHINELIHVVYER